MILPQNRKLAESGFTLIEVLVALVVLAIGMLGLAALQTTGIRYAHGSYQETQATILTYNMIDRIRANPTGKDAGNYDTLDTSTWSDTGDDCLVSACPGALEVSNYDKNQWKQNIANSLGPTATGTIATTGTIRAFTLSWQERDLPMTFKLEVEL